jgi:hypothetical protein
MSRRNQIAVLVVLLAVLGVTIGVHFWPSDDAVKTTPTTGLFTPINVDNPALRMDVLQRFLSLEYKGTHRNIFSSSLPPPPQPVQKIVPVNTAPPVPTGPLPLTVDAKYFGFVSDSAGSHRRAFFATANNEDVFIAGEGDTLMGRFRVVRITNTSADVEEVSTGRHATLALEDPGPNG